VARITGHHALDQVLQLSFRKSILERRFLQVSELHPGDPLIGRIKSVTDKAVFVAISGNVDGVIWPNHFADIMLRHPEKRFKKDASLKCKVNFHAH
jgi:rRNA biogenesis protein RRP5